jgi:hypothetical protein
MIVARSDAGHAIHLRLFRLLVLRSTFYALRFTLYVYDTARTGERFRLRDPADIRRFLIAVGRHGSDEVAP